MALASAVLQLHETPWMNESWDKDDIYFFFNGVDSNRCPAISKPYVIRPVSSPHPTGNETPTVSNSADVNLTPYIINKTLFALGIVLIELCLNKPFEDLRAAAHPADSIPVPNMLDDYQIAMNAVDDVYSEGGEQYGYVVSRCLRCEFQGQNSQKKLDFDRFKSQVYEKILIPLKEDYNQFSLPII